MEGGLRAFVVAENGIPTVMGSGEGVVAETGGFARLGMSEALALAIEDKFGVVDEGHAVRGGKVLGSGTDEIDMLAFFEDETRGLDGIAEPLDACNAAGSHASSVHEQGVQLHTAIGGEEGAAAGIECGVVFENGDGGFDSVERRAGTSEDGVTRIESSANACFVSRLSVSRDGPGSAVDDEGGDVVARGSHRDMVVQLGEARIPFREALVPFWKVVNPRDWRLRRKWLK